jgi:hypothetical protein
MSYVSADIEPESGILTNVGIIASVPSQRRNTRGLPTTVKEEKNKVQQLLYGKSLTRAAFIENTLKVHGLQDVYAIGIGSEPPFKLWWKGIQ